MHMNRREEPAPLPATAPWLLHSLRTVFEARLQHLCEEAQRACRQAREGPVLVTFIHRCMEVTAVYDRERGRFTELRACDVGERGWKQPTYCITMNLRHGPS